MCNRCRDSRPTDNHIPQIPAGTGTGQATSLSGNRYREQEQNKYAKIRDTYGNTTAVLQHKGTIYN